MPRIQREENSPADGVPKVEFVRAWVETLGPDPEQFGFDRIQVQAAIDLWSIDFVQGLSQPLAESLAIDGSVFHAVGNPEVGDARGGERPANRSADFPATDSVLDPELSNAGVRMGQGPTAIHVGM